MIKTIGTTNEIDNVETKLAMIQDITSDSTCDTQIKFSFLNMTYNHTVCKQINNNKLKRYK